MDTSQKKASKIAKKAYAIVLFPNEKRNGKKIIEMIPNSWLSQEKDEWQYFYPPDSEINVATLIELGKPPNPSWKSYAVEIIKTAGNYEQGLRRLERAYTDADIESTTATSGAENDSMVERNSDDASDGSNQQEDVSSTTSSPKKISDMTKQDQRLTKDVGRSQIMAETVINEHNMNDSDDSTQRNEVGSIGGNSGRKKKKRSSAATEGRNTCSSENALFAQINQRMNESDARVEKFYKSLSKQVKGAKQSVLYDFNKKMDAMKNTIIVNRGPGRGNSLKQHKETLGIKLPIENYDAFKEFDAMIKENGDKETALKEIMADSAGTVTLAREAVRKILGGLIMKAVQELYSGTGKKGPNGVTKKNFSGTHVYECMKDVIQDKLETVDGAVILSATSRYLSGAGDREGGKALRDAKKAAE